MEKTKKLIIHLNKNNTTQALIAMPIMLTAMICLLFILPKTTPNILISFCLLLIKAFLYLGIGLFAAGILYYIKYLFGKTDKPVAILDEHGILVNHFGFTPWEGVNDITTYQMPGPNNGMEFIGITVKNRNDLSKQADWSGKIGIFWAKVFGNYDITLSNIDARNEEIIRFARQYMKAT